MMLPKLSRILLIAVTIITLGYTLPSFYQTLFASRKYRPYLTYSIPLKTYFSMENQDGKPVFIDREGKVYTQHAYMDATPVSNFHYHLSNGTMPDSLMGVALQPQILQAENIFQYIRPDMLIAPSYGLYPLFESKPEFGLRFPSDMFRIDQQITFIDAKTNRVNEAKSRQYTDQLRAAGFSFPARVVAGIPSVMKRRDQGWFITDQNDDLFHLKMVQGEPFIKKIPDLSGLAIKHIVCNDFQSDEFYAILISSDDAVYTLNKRDYSVSKMPIEGYHPATHTMIVSGNLFNKTVTLEKPESTQVFTFDREYRLIDEYTKNLPQQSTMWSNKVYGALFPFHLMVEAEYYNFIRPTLTPTPSWNWIYLHGILVLLSILMIRTANREVRESVADLVIVAVTGIFGFIAIWLFPNKAY